MELTEASLKIISSSFPKGNPEGLNLQQVVAQDLESLKKVNEKLNELELAVIERTTPDCNENSPDWPKCKIKIREKLANILKVIVPNAFPENALYSEKVEITIKYIEEIRQDPSKIAPLLE